MRRIVIAGEVLIAASLGATVYAQQAAAPPFATTAEADADRALMPLHATIQ